MSEGFRKILCVHQGYELYGSDRSFIQCVAFIRKAYPEASICVLLPQAGPIVGALLGLGVEVRCDDLWILRKKSILRDVTIGLPQVIKALRNALKKFEDFDLVYINTAVVADFSIAARYHSKKAIVHVREIPVGMARLIIVPLIWWSRAHLIFNSEATKRAFALRNPSQMVIHNAFAGPTSISASNSESPEVLRVVMLGRINAWKGQDLLLDAIAALSPEIRALVQVRIIGGVFEGQSFGADLERKCDELGLRDQVSFEDFVEDPGSAYQWADLAVVPSRLPEPFGRVAIEAMAYGKPVVAARHGGLTEIVCDGASGWLFEPNSIAALSSALAHALTDSTERIRRGNVARLEYERRFTPEALEAKFARALDVVCSGAALKDYATAESRL